MSIETNLIGRLRNTFLPKTHGLFPMFEAVINSIHAIEDANLPDDSGKIIIEIVRKSQINFDFKPEKKPGPEVHEEIVGFKIADNGIGFNDGNMKSFETLDSDYKANRGGRGIGRLLWLKAFRNISVNSVFKNEGGSLQCRKFKFTATTGVSDLKMEDVKDKPVETIVTLEGFEKGYREASKKTVGAIADKLFEHCLWYFVRPGGVSKIYLIDNDQVVFLDDIYTAHMRTSAVSENINIKGQSFGLTHVKLRASGTKPHVIAFCASNRLVKEDNITGKAPGLHSKIKDKDGEFVYACYVSSSFLDENVRAERTDFNLSEDVDGLYGTEDISFAEIKDTIIAKAAEHIGESLTANVKQATSRIEKFVSQKAPRYRPIMSRIPIASLNIDPK